MKKIEQASLFLQQNLDLFKCPICGQPFKHVKNRQLECQLDHSFDLSRKGTLFMITHKIKSEYDNREIWEARRKMLTLGLFDPIVEAISAAMPPRENLKILDIGSGEGTVPAKLKQLKQNSAATLLGIDISKSAVNLATSYQNGNFFCVADLAALPFADQSFDCITDIFSPAAYQEFKRVLKPDGKIYKIIPNSDYLKELRALLYSPESEHQTYDNSGVLSLFAKNFPEFRRHDIKYTFAFPAKDFSSLLMMTPLNWGASEQTKQHVLENPLHQITVDVSLLVAGNEQGRE